MDENYDINSYLASGLGKGFLTLKLVREKVKYEIIGIDSINFNNEKDDIFRYKLCIIGENNKKITNEKGHPIIIYENTESLRNNYMKVPNKKKVLKKKQEYSMVVQIPHTIKVPLDTNTIKLTIIEAGKWIDITNPKNLKIYSDKKFNDIFEFTDDIKKKERMSIKK